MQNTIESERERMLWKIAKKRVGFKNHLFMYLAVNTMFWVLWLIGDREQGGLPWPVFASLGWGFGLLWHYMGAYVFNNKASQVEKEFQRLKEKQGI
jgi:hypothetical protein